MIPHEQLNEFTKKIMSQLGFDDDCKDKKSNNVKKKLINLTPAEIMVISGIVVDVLSVESLTVDRNQQIQILFHYRLKIYH